MDHPKYVFSFEEGDGKNKKLLGGKGANLCEMTQIGLPVPPGFVISNQACKDYYAGAEKLPTGLMKQVQEGMSNLEAKTKKKFGGTENPLLVSVRSGAAMSMPGMMDTILNLGLNDATAKSMIALTSNERFVWDAYRRLLQLFGKVGLQVDESLFEEVFEEEKRKAKAKFDTELSAASLKRVCDRFKEIIKKATGKEFPQDPMEQLSTAIVSVFRSWMGRRAVDYRKQFNITADMADGTAVNVCSMVFGNMGDDSGTGVAFTRNPGTGENQFYGEFLINAQGEDVVSGARTPKPIAELRKLMPKVYQELEKLRHTLEKHYREIQDMEFTIEKGKLYALQTRNGKMNAWAFLRTSSDMVNEGLITKEEALLRIQPDLLEQLLHRRVDPNIKDKPLAQGLAASPGAASGKIVFDADCAERQAKIGEKVILVREETKPEDIHGFFAAQGILTSRGGKTSHAAVVARGMGKPCVSGCEDIAIDHHRREATVGPEVLREGDIITIDGSNGYVYKGALPTVDPEFVDDLLVLLNWADKYSRLEVMANADTPEAARKALEYGAKGIGLCRTERMFNQPERLPIVRNLILAESDEERQKYLDQLLPFQRKDFKEIFRTMGKHPVTVRLLDPPMHEFLPTMEEINLDIRNLQDLSSAVSALQNLPKALELLDSRLHKYIPVIEAAGNELSEIRGKGIDQELVASKEEMLRKVKALSEVNPMLGHRGVRLGISYPQIYSMQIRAVLEAAAELIKEGLPVHPEIMVPQVCTLEELLWVHRSIQEVDKEVKEKYGIQVKYKFGTMVEVVRACLRAGRLAEIAEFFSFGTNDLTQATFSFSREDAENKFLPLYKERQILQDNPFEVLDVKGVGRLMMMTVEWGRKTRKDLVVGICGEQGGHPKGVEFCHEIGMNYVSVSPLRVPIARLAAAHAALKDKGPGRVLDK
jgi:pyruvate,orthophosphate dikinase